MIKKTTDLIFICSINRDGSGTTPVAPDLDAGDNELMLNDKFTLNRLSINYDTYIASGFNSYVVRLKKTPDQKQTTKNKL